MTMFQAIFFPRYRFNPSHCYIVEDVWRNAASIRGMKNTLDEQIGCRQAGLESLCILTYYFDDVLKVVVHEIAKEFPDGWNIPFWYKIPQCCANPKQWSDWKLNFLEIIRWIFYAADIAVFFETANEVKRYSLNILNDTCKRFGMTISIKKTKTQVLKILRIRIVNSVWEQKR